jgi:hypothetical protein
MECSKGRIYLKRTYNLSDSDIKKVNNYCFLHNDFTQPPFPFYRVVYNDRTLNNYKRCIKVHGLKKYLNL